MQELFFDIHYCLRLFYFLLHKVQSRPGRLRWCGNPTQESPQTSWYVFLYLSSVFEQSIQPYLPYWQHLWPADLKMPKRPSWGCPKGPNGGPCMIISTQYMNVFQMALVFPRLRVWVILCTPFIWNGPPVRKLLHSWSLPVVLEALAKPPFEPLAEASLKDVTVKTVFLMAIALGQRRSALHALSTAPGSCKMGAHGCAPYSQSVLHCEESDCLLGPGWDLQSNRYRPILPSRRIKSGVPSGPSNTTGTVRKQSVRATSSLSSLGYSKGALFSRFARHNF